MTRADIGHTQTLNISVGTKSVISNRTIFLDLVLYSGFSFMFSFILILMKQLTPVLPINRRVRNESETSVSNAWGRYKETVAMANSDQTIICLVPHSFMAS